MTRESRRGYADVTAGFEPDAGRWGRTEHREGGAGREGPRGARGGGERTARGMRTHATGLGSAQEVTGEERSDQGVTRFQGPHPQEYPERIHERLRGATANCRTVMVCRKALTTELRKLAEEAVIQGTEINRFLTRGK